MFGLLNKHLAARETRYMPELGGSGSGAPKPTGDCPHGFAAGTRLATQFGWRPVEAITVGDIVLTFDNGPREVVAVTRGTHFTVNDMLPELSRPVSVPAEALGNVEPMLLMPEQIVMIESDAAEAMTGDPFALIAARDLVGFRGVERTLGVRPIETVTVHFEADEVVYTEGGALVLAPAVVPGVATLDFVSDTWMPVPYTVFKSNRARALVAAMALEDARAFGAAAYAAAA